MLRPPAALVGRTQIPAPRAKALVIGAHAEGARIHRRGKMPIFK